MKKQTEEEKLKQNYFSAKKDLHNFLFDKYWKYFRKPIQLKPNVFPKWKGSRIGFYDGFDMPTFMNHGRLHWGIFGKDRYYLSEDEFEIYKKPIKDKNGNIIHFVDVKCGKCGHVGVEDMQYLVYKMNCKKCYHTITTEDIIKKTKKR